MPRIGMRKMYHMISTKAGSENIKGIGRDKFIKIVKREGMANKQRDRRGPVTDSRSTQTVFGNLKKDKEIKGINEVLESDMTAIRIKGDYKPLAICMDVYSRKILGWNLSLDWSTEEVLTALRDANQESGKQLKGCLHHSDRGSQYGSNMYKEAMLALGIEGSMSRKATPTDEAHIERVNKTLKREFNLRRKFETYVEANEAIQMAVIIYNEIRPHWSLGLKTPSQVYEEGQKLTLEPNPLRATPSMG
jgi:putative transposase